MKEITRDYIAETVQTPLAKLADRVGLDGPGLLDLSDDKLGETAEEMPLEVGLLLLALVDDGADFGVVLRLPASVRAAFYALALGVEPSLFGEPPEADWARLLVEHYDGSPMRMASYAMNRGMSAPEAWRAALTDVPQTDIRH